MAMNTLQITPKPTDRDATDGAGAAGGCGCGCSTTAAADESSAALDGAGAGVSATYAVTGMTCSHCVNAVTEELSVLDGVTSVSVDLEGGLVTVVSDQPIGRDLIHAAIDEAGYALV
jgi:copper chaperone CopZ